MSIYHYSPYDMFVFSIVSDAWIALIILLVVILTVCTIGLIGSCYAKRVFLFSYEIFMIVFFSVHFIAFVLYISLSTLIFDYIQKIEQKFSYTFDFIDEHVYEIFKKNLITWNAVVLGVEFFFVFTIPFLIRHLSKKHDKNNTTVVYSPRREIQV